jgi:hypothetical protein
VKDQDAKRVTRYSGRGAKRDYRLEPKIKPTISRLEIWKCPPEVDKQGVNCLFTRYEVIYRQR